jgi:hypothetical protein
MEGYMKNWILSSATLIFLGLSACSTRHPHRPEEPRPKLNVYNDQSTLRNAIKDWPASSRFAAESMMEKYGLPESVSHTTIVWEDTGYFKRSIVYRDGVTHNFPTPHEDVLQQFVGYRVPDDKVKDLWKFDGSIIVDRTRGEISSRCNREEMNTLALNLADGIIQNKMSVLRARDLYEQAALAYMNGQRVPTSMVGLSFSEYLNAGDPDKAVTTRRSLRQAQEAKDEEPEEEEDESEE